MLRTMILDSPWEQKWVLHGRVAGPWAADLKAHWEQTSGARRGRRCVVDLEDVTFIDSKGEDVLFEMAREGAELVSSRAYMKYILADLTPVRH